MHPLRRIRLSAGSALQLPLLPLPSPGKGVTTEAVCNDAEHHWLTQWWSEVFGGGCSDARSKHLRAKDCASAAKRLGLRLYRICFLQSNSLTGTEADRGLALELLQVLQVFLRWLWHLPSLRNVHLVASWGYCKRNIQQGWQQTEIQNISFICSFGM